MASGDTCESEQALYLLPKLGLYEVCPLFLMLQKTQGTGRVGTVLLTAKGTGHELPHTVRYPVPWQWLTLLDMVSVPAFVFLG